MPLKGVHNMRSILSAFPTENAKIIKQDLTVIEDIEALVDRDKSFIDDGSLNIEEGDIIERVLPSGAKEQYLVIDRGFYRGAHGIPDHYQIKVEKQSRYVKLSKGTVINEYHITNADKVNIQSTDNSTTYQITANDISTLDTLRSLAKGLDDEDKIVSAVDEMQESIGKKTFAEKYNAFIQSVANHMTIFAPFIPALSAFLLK